MKVWNEIAPERLVFVSHQVWVWMKLQCKLM